MVRQAAMSHGDIAKQGHQHLVLGIGAMLGMHYQQRKAVHMQMKCLWHGEGSGCDPVFSAAAGNLVLWRWRAVAGTAGMPLCMGATSVRQQQCQRA